MSLEFQVTGLTETIAKMRDLRDSVQKRHVEGAGRAAMKPVVSDVRSHVAVRHGALRKSIGTKKAKKAAPGEIVLSVGARRGYAYKDERGHNVDPFFYAIPYEYGHVVKNPHTGQVVAWVAPAGAFRGAYERGRIRIVDDFAKELGTRIEGALK